VKLIRLDSENMIKLFWQPRRNVIRIDHSQKVMGAWQSKGSAEFDLGPFCKEEKIDVTDIATAMSVAMAGLDQALPGGWNRHKPKDKEQTISVSIPIGE
jgi:hypothetical protein